MSLDKTHYDVAILSTALPQAILSAALSSAGLSVIHLDQHDYYADTWASLTLSELHRWASHEQPGISQLQLRYPAYAEAQPSSDTSSPSPSRPAIPQQLLHLDRHYALSLAPTLLPATGPSIDALIASNVSSYATFRLLEHTAVYTPPTSGASSSSSSSSTSRLARVPSSKEDVFKAKSLSLIAKRKLMKLLLHIASDDWDADIKDDAALADRPFVEYLEQRHRLSPDLVAAVAYGVSLCSSPLDTTLEALQRARAHLQSIGRYGNSAYLVGQYGGAGELAQGYCRASAVKGGMFILDHKIESLKRVEEPSEQAAGEGSTSSRGQTWQVQVAGIDQGITADVVVSSDEILDSLAAPQVSQAAGAAPPAASLDTIRGVLVFDRPIDFEAGSRESQQEGEAAEGAQAAPQQPTPPETGLLVLPPSTIGEGAASNQSTVMVLMMGEGTFSCPKGQYVYYIQTQGDGSSKLPKEVLQPTVDLILDLASQTRFPPDASSSSESDNDAPIRIALPPNPSITSLTDQAVSQAELAYYDVLAQLHRRRWGVSKDVARERVMQVAETRKVRRRGGRRKRDPAEYQGRGGRGEDDGVAEQGEEREQEAEDDGADEDEEYGVVTFFEKREEEDRDGGEGED
ncbi:related to Rab proteins geranylgeranyltransferase component A 2 [Pseudozyma flocculosa]|uniref:Related to Rab proteins geranylgeranyltransferase component A 2 n=1 Tax=Pseudozyma flocculosa TaxID=84751 RepID=A0A5C3EYD2_9BASI|nr:related to Rab proteins geranylgeranyltransferase component A 2 [Pseudozyma flocculosa]